MTTNPPQLSQSSTVKYERLTRLVEHYEHGELSDADFQNLKHWILLDTDQETAGEPQFELMIASFGTTRQLREASAALRTARLAHRADVLDALLTIGDVPGAVQVRPLDDLTRRVRDGGVSIAGFMCGLLFARTSLSLAIADSSIEASFDVAERAGIASEELRSLGCSTAPGGRSLIVVAWRRAADPVAACLSDYERFVRIVLDRRIGTTLLRHLVEELEH